MPKTATGRSGQAEQRYQMLVLNRVGNRYRPLIAREINRAMRQSATLIAGGTGYAAAVKAILPKHKKNMATILEKLWRQSGDVMSENIAGQAKASRSHIERKAEDDDEIEIPPTEIADQAMTDWINQFGGEQITEITRSTQNDITDIITDGVAEGIGEKAIAQNIRTVSPFISGTRAQTIARTETHSAGNVASWATANATGVKLERVWVAAKNERTRPTHDKADGQRTTMTKAFTVGGAKLMYPSDRNGPAREVINCRCAVSYVIAR
ncbi:MAG: hypothetical protein KAT00_00045 [Planctomycetes bacterium]|nr:hypothetical protein [Planctomycetota bacterium]